METWSVRENASAREAYRPLRCPLVHWCSPPMVVALAMVVPQSATSACTNGRESA